MRRMRLKKIGGLLTACVLAVAVILAGSPECRQTLQTRYWRWVAYSGRIMEGNYIVEYHHTNKCTPGINRVNAVVLHHTAAMDDIRGTVWCMCYASEEKYSCHVIIDYDGSRYVLASPDKITWHAGKSWLNGRDSVNLFSIGVEFQGNTCERPLTDDQIESALDYLLPIINEYNIPLENVVTHRQIRHDWIERNPQLACDLEKQGKPVPEKKDITQTEYDRFIGRLKCRLANDSNRQL